MARIEFSGRAGAGRFVLVDEEDYERMARYRWWFSNGYAVRSPTAAEAVVQGYNNKIRMHRDILGVGLSGSDPREVDHINGNPLDNRKGNLRLVSRSENEQNRPHSTRSQTRTGVRGVIPTASGTFQARVYVGYRQVFCKNFKTLEEADAAVRAARARLMPSSAEART